MVTRFSLWSHMTTPVNRDKYPVTYSKVYYQHIAFVLSPSSLFLLFFFLNDPPTPEIYPLPLHDALPISSPPSFSLPFCMALLCSSAACLPAAGGLGELNSASPNPASPPPNPVSCRGPARLRQAGTAAPHLEITNASWQFPFSSSFLCRVDFFRPLRPRPAQNAA